MSDHVVAKPRPTFQWRRGKPPSQLRVTQVYGWLFDAEGRVLVQQTPDDRFNLPGGTPEPYDCDVLGTLHREADEESQVDVEEPAWLGFEEMRVVGEEPVVMLRFVGRVGGFRQRRPDVDGGRLLRRRLVSLATVPALLDWGEAGTAQASDAGRLAEQLWALPVRAPTAPDVEVL